jgi:hypothetical protein
MNPVSEHDLHDVWAAQVELRLKRNTPEYSRGFRGAYTTILVRCQNASEFISAASEHVDREGFEIVGLEMLFPLAAGQIEVSDTLSSLIGQTHEYPVQWTTFHLFKDDA